MLKKNSVFNLFIIITLCYSPVHAQSLRWGISGGSIDGTPGGTDETVVDMTTDPNGNVYVLSNVYQTSLSVDGHPLGGYGSQDILLSSFKCDGTYRWSKLLGGSSADIAASVKADGLGGIYICGYFSSHFITLHLDSDTSWLTGASYKNLFVAKYDTAGNYKWLNMPQPDTAGPATPSHVRTLDMDVDSAGNVYAMFACTPGAYAGGSYVAPTEGAYVLQYNSSGAFINGTQLSIQYATIATGGLLMKRDFAQRKYYITGELSYTTSLKFNGSAIDQRIFIGAFDNSGSLLWQRENTSGYGAGFGRANIDAQHDIYVTGISQAFTTPDTFNTYTIHNTISITGEAPLTVKLDTNGNNIWANNASCAHATYSNNLVLNGSYVTVSGSYNGKMVCPGLDSLFHPTAVGEGYDVFLMQMDAATGNFTKLDTITSSFSGNENSSAITADEHGNVYVGGNFDEALYANSDTLNYVGGGSDFFAVKYGYDNCNCTTVPTANYSYTGTDTISFTYTGTVTGLDSVVWNFGDGTTDTGINAIHSYTAAGTYTACVTVYTACGSNTHCTTISITTVGIATPAAVFPGVQVYPNPASNVLFIDRAAGMQVVLFNLVGQQVYSSIVTGNNYSIDISYLAPGTYLIKLTSNKGTSAKMITVKK